MSAADAAVAQSVFETELGWMGVAGTTSGAVRLTFGHETETDAMRRLSLAPGEMSPFVWMDEAAEVLKQYAQGTETDLSRIPIDLPPTTPFRRRVRDVVRSIPAGETLTYGQVAALAGRPGAARAVGTVMSSNPVPLLIPCHRVVGAAGGLGGYSAPQGLPMKRRLLILECQGQESVFPGNF